MTSNLKIHIAPLRLLARQLQLCSCLGFLCLRIPLLGDPSPLSPNASSQLLPSASFEAMPNEIPVPISNSALPGNIRAVDSLASESTIRIQISVFNSAGDLVKDLFQGSIQYIPLSFTASAALLQAGTGSVRVLLGPASLNGSGTLEWDGTNTLGQDLPEGQYYFKAQFTDIFGVNTAMIAPVALADSQGQRTLRIYSSSNELVASQDLRAIAPQAKDFRLSSAAFSPRSDSSLRPQIGQSVTFIFEQEDGSPTTWIWNGRNSLGTLVSSGSYSARLSISEPGGLTKTIAHGVSVLDPGSISEDPLPLLGPNPAPASALAVSVVYKPQMGDWAYARAYDAGGSLVARGADPAGIGSLSLRTAGLAGGIYEVEFELRNGGGVAYRKILKMAVTR